MVCENEMRYVILQKNILKLLTHVKEKSKNKSQILRGKSQALRNETQILRSDHYTEEVNKIEIKAAEKVELIYGAMHELQDEIYSDDSWLRLVELNKIDTIIDEALNVVCKRFMEKIK